MAENHHEPGEDTARAGISVQTGRKIAATVLVLLLAIVVLSVAGNALRRATYQAVDPFATLQITPHGESPDVSLDVEWTRDTPFLQAVEVTVPENLSELKNGDTLTFSASVDQSVCDEYKMKLSGTSYTYTVDVPDYEEVDPFAKLEVKVEGISPDVTLEYAQMDDSPFLNTVHISVDRNRYLANGDTVIFTAEVSGDVCDEYRMKLSRDSMTYTVAVEESYLTQAVELSDEVRASLADNACRSMADILEQSNDMPYNVCSALSDLYAGGQYTSRWEVGQYTIQPLSVIITKPDTYHSRIYIVLEVSAVYNTDAETDPAAPITNTSIWGIRYFNTVANGTEVLSFIDDGAAYFFQDDPEDLRFDIRRQYGAISEIDLSDMSETTSS